MSEDEEISPYALIGTLQQRIAELEAQLELSRMQVAAVMTATVQNSESTIKDRIGRDHHYWTQAYADVCIAVDREVAHRKERERLEKENAELRATNEHLSENLRLKIAAYQECDQLRAQVVRLREALKEINTIGAGSQFSLAMHMACRAKDYLSESPQQAAKEMLGPMHVALSNWHSFGPDLAQLLDGWHNDGTVWSEHDESIRKKLALLQATTQKEIERIERVLG